MSQSQKHIHELYHEAQRRAKLPQLQSKYTKSKELLLSAPNNIIFELFNTIIKAISSEKLLEYVSNHLKEYLDINWSNKITQQVIRRLRRDQVLEIRAGHSSAPSILSLNQTDTTLENQKSTSSDNGSENSKRHSRDHQVDTKRMTTSKQKTIDVIYEHLMWRIKTGNITQITSLMTKLVIDYGYKSNILRAELYEDVLDCFKDWRSKKLIKLYSFGDAPANDQKLLLASTTCGDLTQLVANYIDGSDKRKHPDLIRKLALALRDKTKNCIFITNELVDALQSIDTGAIRCAIVVDRLKQYDNLENIEGGFNDKIKPMLAGGKLYIVDSLDCIEFAPDPDNDTCC